MPIQNGGFTNSIATQQANQSSDPFFSQISKDRPWEYNFSTRKTDHTGVHYGTGPSGAGYYDMKGQGSQALGAQQHYTQEFKDNMPHLNDLLTSQLGGQINSQMSQGIQNSKVMDSRRGLLYGGMHQGHEGQIQAQAAGQMAQGKSAINAGLQNAYEGMQNSTIKTGIDFQQQQQQLQNSIYQNALANMMNQQKAFSSLGSAVGTGVGMYYGGMMGGPTGAMAGGQLGSQAGSQVF